MNWATRRSAYVHHVLEALISVLILLPDIRAAYLNSGDVDFYTLPSGAGAGHVVQYVHIKRNMLFNEATATCRALGGGIAKIESNTKRTWIASLANDINGTTNQIFAADMWTGVTEKKQGQYVWVADCSTDTPASTDGQSFDVEECCFVHRPENDAFSRRKCYEGSAIRVLCEVSTAKNNSDLPSNGPDFSTADDPDTTCTPAATPAPTPAPTPTPTPGPTPAPTPALTTTTTPATSATTLTPPTTLTTSSKTSSSSTTSQAPTTSANAVTTAGYITVCVNVKNITMAEAVSKAEEISRNLTVDSSETSSHRRTLTCAEDSRPSAQTVGSLGIVFISVLFALIVLTDMIKVYEHFTSHHLRKKRT